jgi:hypothetical protein
MQCGDKNRGKNAVVPKDTILIDACAEHTITRKNLINWVEVSVGHNLPFDIDSLSFARQCSIWIKVFLHLR